MGGYIPIIWLQPSLVVNFGIRKSIIAKKIGHFALISGQKKSFHFRPRAYLANPVLLHPLQTEIDKIWVKNANLPSQCSAIWHYLRRAINAIFYV